jgi:hypothetical protein
MKLDVPANPATYSGERLPRVTREQTGALNEASLHVFLRTLYHYFVCSTYKV